MSSPRWRRYFSSPNSKQRLSAGSPHPLGATWDARGTNFALFSANAEKVELCLFDSQGRNELERVTLPERNEDIWHGYLNDVAPGQLYGYRVYGPYAPEQGHRFNHHKLLIDPYAKRLAGRLTWTDAHFGYRTGNPRQDLSFDRRDNARAMPKAVVIDEAFTWGSEMRPSVHLADTVIYEAHVKGLTQNRDDVPPAMRGNFSGLASPGVINHLKHLGVTAIELLPVQAFVNDRHLVERDLSNYWGYSPICYFSPEPRYAPDGSALDAFRSTVSRLHDAGIEIILDVVYNHTAEGNHLGPTLSYRGIDNRSYYWLLPDQPRYYDDFTGCGNALNLAQPRVLQMVMDSLRYWVEVCHVDGFRFDLATTLARGPNGFDAGAAFFSAVRQDPVLTHVKLIAEPWDLGLGGYQVGNFPSGWLEWNDAYRNVLRRYWSGEGNLIGELGSRMTGSADIFRRTRRSPLASINHITVHDGFTMMDLVSYAEKHNEQNGEDNNDGADENFSNNWGVEGPTDNPEILALRRRLRKNYFASLMLAHGVPLLLAGDEVGNSQGGNNNAYCQDNAIGWVDWSGLADEQSNLSDFVAQLTELRRRFPQLRPHHWVEGKREDGSYGVLWFTPQATEKTVEDWNFPEGRFISYVLGPAAENGAPLYIALNGADEIIEVTLPTVPKCRQWALELNTAEDSPPPQTWSAGDKLDVSPRSVLVLSGVA